MHQVVDMNECVRLMNFDEMREVDLAIFECLGQRQLGLNWALSFEVPSLGSNDANMIFGGSRGSAEEGR